MTRQDVFNGARFLWCLWPLALAGCEQPGAPSAIGVCWRTDGAATQKPKFTVVANDVDSLDNCAALLEAYHLQGAKTANGAYQGYFIFIDDHEVASSTRANGFRYPIFQPAQRREIDSDLNHLLKERAGRPPSPSDIAVERR